jgi:hypothetical protein
MHARKIRRTISTIFPLLLLVGLTDVARAVDGVVLISQNTALTGNVTPGDEPGFPISINQPGSYRLTSNLVVPASLNGIEIKADRVTVDLNGFAIIKAGNVSGEFAIKALPPAATNNVRVANGIITGFPNGVYLQVTEGYVDSVQVTQAPDNSPPEDPRQGNPPLYNIYVLSGAITHSISIAAQPFNSFIIAIGCKNNCLIAGNNIKSGTAGVWVALNALVTGNVITDSWDVALGVEGQVGGNFGVGYKDNIITPQPGRFAVGIAAINMGNNVCGTALCP